MNEAQGAAMAAGDRGERRPRRRPAGAGPTAPVVDRSRSYRHLVNPFEPLKVFSDDNVAAIHEAALRILENQGMRVLLPEAREAYRRGGATVDESTLNVRFDRGLVTESLAQAPREITLHAKDADRHMPIFGRHVVFAPTSGPPNIMDTARGKRPGTFEDFSNILKLCQNHEVIHVLGGGVEPLHDRPGHDSDRADEAEPCGQFHRHRTREVARFEGSYRRRDGCIAAHGVGCILGAGRRRAGAKGPAASTAPADTADRAAQQHAFAQARRAEIAPDVLERCDRIVVDSVSQAQKLSRELIDFFGTADQDGWQRVKSLANLVAAGETRVAQDDLTLFKSLGMGISDLALGIELYQKARAMGLGREFAQPQRVTPRLRAAQTLSR